MALTVFQTEDAERLASTTDVDTGLDRKQGPDFH